MRNFRIISPFLLLFYFTVYSAEETPWHLDIDANITITQNAYSESWIGSEKGAVSWASKFNIIAEKQILSFLYHRNTLKLQFGQTKTQNEDHSWGKLMKSTDLIDFESLQRFIINGWGEPYIALRLISQFVDGLDTLQNHYLNPLNIFESFGMSRTFLSINSVKWDARIGFAINQVINRYTFDELHNNFYNKIVNSAGFELVTELKSKFKKDLLDYRLLFTLYEALVSSEAEKMKGTNRENFWRYPDINWENILSVNITKYIMINLTAQLLYDREQHPNARIKEVLALGLTYKFSNAKTKQ